MNTGDRMKEIRTSLDPERGPVPVPLAAVDRCYGAFNRWEWLEELVDASSHEAVIRESVLAIAERLDVAPEAAEQAVAFALGKRDTLPWSRPRWREGMSPIKRMGRRGRPNKTASEPVALPPRAYEIQLYALLRAHKAGELSDQDTVATITRLAVASNSFDDKKCA